MLQVRVINENWIFRHVQPEELRWTISKDNRKSLGSSRTSRPGQLRCVRRYSNVYTHARTHTHIYMDTPRVGRFSCTWPRIHAPTPEVHRVMDATHDTPALDLRLSRFINRENSKSVKATDSIFSPIANNKFYQPFLSFFLFWDSKLRSCRLIEFYDR